jgi:DNA-binding beta-propeller fold protein YncE
MGYFVSIRTPGGAARAQVFLGRRVELLVRTALVFMAAVVVELTVPMLVQATVSAATDSVTVHITTRSDSAVAPATATTKSFGRPISVGSAPAKVAITPDVTTAYVLNQGSNSVTPIAVTANTPGRQSC